MVFWLRVARFAIAGGLVFATSSAALAQSAAPTPAAKADPIFLSQKASFDAMPEAERRALQSGMVWLGFYNGEVDGAFGVRTRDSILAYQASVKAAPTGVVSDAQLAAIKSESGKISASFGFGPLDDKGTGIRIGAPLKALVKRMVKSGQSKLASADGSLSLDLQSSAGADADLAALYAKDSAASAARKVTYKAFRADNFYVVSGEEGGRKFYSRFAKSPAPAGSAGEVRGFTFAYPATQAGLYDKVVLAMASAFEPFAAPIVAGSPAPSPAPLAVVSSPPTPAPSPAPIIPATPAGPVLIATGLLVAPGQILTVAEVARCTSPLANGKPAKLFRTDASSGLALLSSDLGAGVIASPIGGDGGELVILSFAAPAGSGPPILQAAAASPLGAPPPLTLLAALPARAAGSPAFDRAGRLAALIGQNANEPSYAAAYVSPHNAIGVSDIKAFLNVGESKAGDASLTAGAIARDKKGLVVSISCVTGVK